MNVYLNQLRESVYDHWFQDLSYNLIFSRLIIVLVFNEFFNFKNMVFLNQLHGSCEEE